MDMLNITLVAVKDTDIVIVHIAVSSQPFNFPRNVCDFVDDVRRLSNFDAVI